MTSIDTLRSNVQAARSKCTKKNPTMCRIHGDFYREQQNMYVQALEHQKDLEFRAVAAPDFEESWDLKKTRDGVVTVSVYRSGIPEAPKQRGVENDYYARADALRPKGRQGRMDGVFASPTLGGVCRWVRGNEMTRIPDVKVREMRVDIDTTYVYSIEAWEKASSWNKPEDYEKFWNSGMTMREYMGKAKVDPQKYNPENWELLLSQEDIKSIKPVGAKRVSERAYNSYNVREVRNILNDKPLNYQTKAEIEKERNS